MADEKDPYVKIRPLLDFIGQLEAGGNYNAVFGNARNSDDLSRYTLAEIHDKQLAHGRRTGSSAFGKYQFIRKTLLGLRKKLRLSPSDRFTPELQDRLAISLLNTSGLQKWLGNRWDDERFMDSLSRVWASLPYRTGRSYYDGDGMNHALATRGEVREVLQQVRAS